MMITSGKVAVESLTQRTLGQSLGGIYVVKLAFFQIGKEGIHQGVKGLEVGPPGLGAFTKSLQIIPRTTRLKATVWLIRRDKVIKFYPIDPLVSSSLLTNPS